jgi:hypothetical protein
MEQTKLKVMVREVNQLAWRYKQAQVQVKMYQPTLDRQQKQLHDDNLKFIEAFQYILDHMAELKGQILGILLVLTIFGAMSVAFTGIFNNAASNIAQQVSETYNV